MLKSLNKRLSDYCGKLIQKGNGEGSRSIYELSLILYLPMQSISYHDTDLDEL